MRKYLKKFWKFFWHTDSLGSWLLNVVVFFLLIRFIIYPVLGIVLGTGFPIVAVISESMEHTIDDRELICGQRLPQFKDSFDNYWEVCGSWYENNDITKEQFKKFPLSNGFDKGDVIILWRANPNNLEVGDILIFQGDKPQPVIHRVIHIWQENDETFYQTKGDHNTNSIAEPLEETRISQQRIFGQGVLRIPYFGWIKILFVDFASIFGIQIER